MIAIDVDKVGRRTVAIALQRWVPPSLNELIRVHWRKRKKVGDEAHALMLEGGLVAHRPPDSAIIRRHVETPVFLPKLGIGDTIAACRVSISIMHYIKRGTSMRDWDNLLGGLKPVLDCLQHRSTKAPNGLGIIVDDSPRCIIECPVVFYKVVRQPAAQCTLVSIVEHLEGVSRAKS